MAIVQQSPKTYSPAYNPMWSVLTSVNTAHPNFQYLCDVYITGVTFAGGASYIRLKCPADPTYGSGVFNVAPIVQRYLSSDLGDTIYGFQNCSNSILQYQLKFGEEYGPSSGVTQYPNQAVDSVRYAFPGSLQVLENNDYTVNRYVASNSSNIISTLTNAPSSGTISLGYSQWIYAMSQTSGAIKYANINSYNSAGVLTNTAIVINYQYYNTSTIANRMIRFPAGYNVSQITTGIVSGTLANWLNTTSNYKWEIYFTDTDHNRITNSFYSSWDTDCSEQTPYHLYFKNKYGAFDTFDFTRASQKSSDIKRSQYEKVIGEFKSSISYTYNDADRHNTSFYTSYKENIKLTSNWISESQSTWLQELLTSPDIRVDNGSHYLVPVNIIETKHIQRQHLTDKIFNLEINIQYSFEEVRQGA